jgi:hypothetical protein
MRKLRHAGGAAVATLSLMLTVCAFTVPGRPAAHHPPAHHPPAHHPPALRLSGPMVAAAGHAEPGRLLDGRTVVVHSLNWAGYAAARAGTAFRSVRAAFFVPYVDCTSTPGSYSSHWAGLDGLGSSSVEQLGVAAGCAGSQPQYYAWYEMYPKPVSGVFAVKAGNAIVVSVYYQAQQRKFVLTLRDLTTGQHFSQAEKCAARTCARSSAEVISEAPSDTSGTILPLADYRAASFSGITLTSAAGHRGGLVSRWWSMYRIIGVGPSSRQVTQQPTSLLRGQAFTNYWIRED